MSDGWTLDSQLLLYTFLIRWRERREMAIQSFKNKTTAALFVGRCPKGFPADLFKIVRRKLNMVDAAEMLDDLRSPPGNRLEALRGDRESQHSIRLNDQFRICFRWEKTGPVDVEIVDYH